MADKYRFFTEDIVEFLGIRRIDRSFLVPREIVRDSALTCADLHSDFAGDIDLYCPDPDEDALLRPQFVLNQCTDTIFSPFPDVEPVGRYSVRYLTRASVPDCRKACMDHSLQMIAQYSEHKMCIAFVFWTAVGLVVLDEVTNRPIGAQAISAKTDNCMIYTKVPWATFSEDFKRGAEQFVQLGPERGAEA